MLLHFVSVACRGLGLLGRPMEYFMDLLVSLLCVLRHACMVLCFLLCQRTHTRAHTHTQTRTHAHIHTNAWTHAGVSAMIVHKDLRIYVFVYTYVCEDGGRVVRQTCVCVYLLLLPGCHLNRVVTCVANSHIRFRLAEIGWCGCHFVQLVCWSLTLCWHRLAVKKKTKNKKTNQ